MKNLERLELEKREMLMKINEISKTQQDSSVKMDIAKQASDLNMKLSDQRLEVKYPINIV